MVLVASKIAVVGFVIGLDLRKQTDCFVKMESVNHGRGDESYNR